MMHSGICTGVTGLNMTDSPAPGVAVMRCIREGGGRKFTGVGFGYDSLDAGLYEKQYFKHVYLLPYPFEGPDSLLDRILAVHRKSPMNVIIPTLDAELVNFITIRDSLHENGIMTFFPTREQFEMCSKINLHVFGEKAGIDIPESQVEKDMKKINMAVEKMGFPIMVKGIFYEAYKAGTLDEVFQFIRKISAKWGMPVIFQKFIEGTELDVAALGDGRGGCMGYVPMRKLIITDKGKGWAAVTINDEGISEFVAKFFKATKWQGPVELEIVKENETGKYYLIEVNNRFPAWIYLSKAAGINLPLMTVKLAMGEKVRKTRTPKPGIIYNRGTMDYILDMKQLETMDIQGELHHE